MHLTSLLTRFNALGTLENTKHSTETQHKERKAIYSKVCPPISKAYKSTPPFRLMFNAPTPLCPQRTQKLLSHRRCPEKMNNSTAQRQRQEESGFPNANAHSPKRKGANSSSEYPMKWGAKNAHVLPIHNQHQRPF